LWEWFENLDPGARPRPRVEVWPRGGAKSSTGELGVVRVGTREVLLQNKGEEPELRPARRFVLYVSGTQGQANKHVQSIATKFENLNVARAVGKYGNSKGWRVDLLRCVNGFNCLALGLDAAARGIKLDDFRPDLIIFDDIDERHDSDEAVKKKIETITDSILPAGATDCAILFLQNKIHRNSIVSMLCDGRADFLLDREPPCAEPAVEGLEYESVEQPDGTRRYRITAGRATWEGQSLAVCEQQLNDWGRASFEREAQHKVEEEENGLWNRVRDIEPFRVLRSRMPRLARVGVAIDPSGSARGDEVGIIGGGIAKVGGKWHGYIFADRSLFGSPREWAQNGVSLYHEIQADVLLAEINFGGDMVETTIESVEDAPPVKKIHVSRGKLIRAEPVQKLYEDGRVHHVIGAGLEKLESEQCNYQQGDKDSPGRMDAAVILLTELMLGYAETAMDEDAYKRLTG
jgi:hypothetical protein